MTNLDSVLKSRDITLLTKVHIVKSMVFLVVTYGCESWTVKKAECQRIDAFKLCCWRRLLKVPWTARRSHQSILREINPEYPLEGLMLRLKLQYFGHLMRTANSREKSLMLGKIEGRRRGRHQGMRWLDGITNAMDMNFGKLRKTVRDREVWCAWVHKELDMTGRLNNKVLFTKPPSRRIIAHQVIFIFFLHCNTSNIQMRLCGVMNVYIICTLKGHISH